VKYIYVKGGNLPSVIQNTTSSFGWSLNGVSSRGYDMKGRGESPFDEEDQDLYLFLVGFHSSPFSVSPSGGGDVNYCGISFYPCETIDYVKETKTFSSSSVNTLSLSTNSFTQQQFIINDYSYSFIGSHQQNTNISFSVTNVVIFPITTGSLSLSTLSLLPSSSSHTASLITVSSTGTLSLSSCIICLSSETSTFMSSLISATIGTIEISSTIMKNIMNTVNDGGGI
jgi:hypothetical protein